MEKVNLEKPRKTKIKQRVVIVLCAVIFIQIFALGIIIWYTGGKKDNSKSEYPEYHGNFPEEYKYWKKLNVK